MAVGRRSQLEEDYEWDGGDILLPLAYRASSELERRGVGGEEFGEHRLTSGKPTRYLRNRRALVSTVSRRVMALFTSM